MPNRKLFSAMSQLRSVLRTLELEVGVENLSKAELDVLSAAIQISDADPQNTVTTAQVVDHSLVQQLGRSTIYRSIASLEKRGLFVPNKSGYNAEYSLSLSAS